MTENEQRFLIGLTELTRDTNVVIAGCGCCGSPFLQPLKQVEEQAGYGEGYIDEIAWITPSDEYAWEHFAHSIVR